MSTVVNLCNLCPSKMLFNRMYHVSSVTYNMKKQGMKLNKLLNPKQKRQWYPSTQQMDQLPTVRSLTRVKYEPGKQGIRRLAMLNKLFMKHITDIMSTGTVSMGVVGRGIEISKVNMAADFKTVNVYWVCKGDSRDDEIEDLLRKVAGPLRHELSTLRAMGEVPYIIFVKDKHEAQLVDLDRRLAVADYGEDYSPTDMGHLLKSEFVLASKLSPEMKAKIKQLESETIIEEEPIPEMTHNVFGLDHAKIMNRLLAARKRTSDAWVNLDIAAQPMLTYRRPALSVENEDVTKQKQELTDFLKKRQIQQGKLERKLRRETLDNLMYVMEKKKEEGGEEDVPQELEEDKRDYIDEYDYDLPESYDIRGSPRRLQLDPSK